MVERHACAYALTDGRKAGTASIEEAIYDAIQGHSGGGAGRGYELGYPLHVLAEAMAEVKYPALALSKVA